RRRLTGAAVQAAGLVRTLATGEPHARPLGPKRGSPGTGALRGHPRVDRAAVAPKQSGAPIFGTVGPPPVPHRASLGRPSNAHGVPARLPSGSGVGPEGASTPVVVDRWPPQTNPGTGPASGYA